MHKTFSLGKKDSLEKGFGKLLDLCTQGSQ